MTRTIFAALALLAAAPLSLHAQLPESASERIEAARARAAQANIPVELIESKIAEGRAKGVAEARIAFAVERRAAALTRAQGALAHRGRNPSGDELDAGADAMEAGVDANALRSAIEGAPDGKGAVAIAVLGALVGQGIPVENALGMVKQATSGGGDALANLPAQAAAARERRGPPAGIGRAGGGQGGGRPSGVGAAPGGVPSGPPAGVPAGGATAGSGKPAGTPGGRPGGIPAGGR